MAKTKSKPKPEAIPVCSVSIFGRIWETPGTLTPELAKHVLKIRFPPEDLARMHELSAKVGRGEILPAELAELDEYILVGDLLGILQSKARRRLGIKLRLPQ